MADTPLGEVIERLRVELAELKDRGAPVCEQYAWSSIRHVERNVDLDCCPEDDEHECDGWGRYSGTALAVLWNARTDILAALKAGQEYVDARKARVRGGSTDVYVSRPMAVHTYECPEPKYGKKSGPCDCGGGALDEAIKGAEAALLAAYGKE